MGSHVEPAKTPQTGQEPSPLAKLATEINEHHRAAETALRSGLEHALEAGRLLMEAKGRCQHGTWGGWLEEHFEGSERTARVYMQVAKRWPEIQAKRQHVADLTFRDALKLLAAPKVPDTEQVERQLVDLRARLADISTIADLPERVRACKEIVDEATSLESRLRENREFSIEESWQEVFFRPLPRLSPEYVFLGSVSSNELVEIRPSLEHRRYYRLAHYRDLETDRPVVEYDRRPVRYTHGLLQKRIRQTGCGKIACWVADKHDGQEWPPCCEPDEEGTA